LADHRTEARKIQRRDIELARAVQFHDRVSNDLRNDLNGHIQDLSLGFFTQNATGTLLSRATSDVYVIGSALTNSVASVLKDGGWVGLSDSW